MGIKMRDWEELNIIRAKLVKQIKAQPDLAEVTFALLQYFSVAERQIKKMKIELKKLNGEKK